MTPIEYAYRIRQVTIYLQEAAKSIPVIQSIADLRELADEIEQEE